MTTASLTAADARLHTAVVRQLDRALELGDSAIDIAVDEGVVTLTGVVGSHAGKRAAEGIARRVPGVWAVVNDLTVRANVDWKDADATADATHDPKLRSILQKTFR